jgi:hypothetical protein
MQFHEIQAQVAVADLRGGPDLEMIVGDLAGNVVCLNIEGDILWDARSPAPSGYSNPPPPPSQTVRWRLSTGHHRRCGWRWGAGRGSVRLCL